MTKADRYLYLPSVGFCLVLACCIERCWTALNPLHVSTCRKRIVLCGYWLMMSLMFASYTFLTSQRNLDWKNSHSLWTATLKTNPNSPIALNNLGLMYAQQGMYEKRDLIGMLSKTSFSLEQFLDKSDGTSYSQIDPCDVYVKSERSFTIMDFEVVGEITYKRA